jgi:hypothetical protein
MRLIYRNLLGGFGFWARLLSCKAATQESRRAARRDEKSLTTAQTTEHHAAIHRGTAHLSPPCSKSNHRPSRSDPPLSTKSAVTRRPGRHWHARFAPARAQSTTGAKSGGAVCVCAGADAKSGGRSAAVAGAVSGVLASLAATSSRLMRIAVSSISCSSSSPPLLAPSGPFNRAGSGSSPKRADSPPLRWPSLLPPGRSGTVAEDGALFRSFVCCAADVGVAARAATTSSGAGGS